MNKPETGGVCVCVCVCVCVSMFRIRSDCRPKIIKEDLNVKCWKPLYTAEDEEHTHTHTLISCFWKQSGCMSFRGLFSAGAAVKEEEEEDYLEEKEDDQDEDEDEYWWRCQLSQDK